ncbi:MAG TPA: YMGG-like glycine zipper-containing protein [Prosthecobacter sp.]
MKTLFRHWAGAAAVGLALTLSSCVSPYAGPNERDGAVIGAVGGGTLGAIIGNQSGRPLEGAAIGGALGALAGASIGANRDDYYYGGRPVYYRSSPRYYGYGYGYRRPYGYYGRPYYRHYGHRHW